MYLLSNHPKKSMRFVAGSPAVIHHDALIVGDLHFGMEHSLHKKGIYTKDISRIVCDELISLLEKTKSKKLILLGDVKENILSVDAITRQMVARLSESAQVIIVKGNHDGAIEKLGVETHPPAGFVYKGLGLCHGHALPAPELMEQAHIISAHHHPQLEMVDASGTVHAVPCVVVAPVDLEFAQKQYPNVEKNLSLVLLPAFNRMLGNAINNPKQRLFGPLFKNNLFKYDDALLYNLEGTVIGAGSMRKRI